MGCLRAWRPLRVSWALLSLSSPFLGAPVLPPAPPKAAAPVPRLSVLPEGPCARPSLEDASPTFQLCSVCRGGGGPEPTSPPPFSWPHWHGPGLTGQAGAVYGAPPPDCEPQPPAQRPDGAEAASGPTCTLGSQPTSTRSGPAPASLCSCRRRSTSMHFLEAETPSRSTGSSEATVTWTCPSCT